MRLDEKAYLGLVIVGMGLLVGVGIGAMIVEISAKKACQTKAQRKVYAK